MKNKKFHLLYYKNLIDLALTNFFKDYNNCFIKQENYYIFSKNFSKTKLKNIFKNYIKNEILNYIKPYNILDLKYYFLIGSCFPKDNILLKFKNSLYFPKKLDILINSKYNIKYFLKEKDIKLDLIKFNDIFIDIFNEFFTSRKKILNFFGKNYKNLFFIQHKNLDCYSMFKTIKFIVGKNNCENIYKTCLLDKKSILCSINEKIDLYINNKNKLNKSKEYNYIIQDIKLFIENCLKTLI